MKTLNKIKKYYLVITKKELKLLIKGLKNDIDTEVLYFYESKKYAGQLRDKKSIDSYNKVMGLK
jgi:hypothetical protein